MTSWRALDQLDLLWQGSRLCAIIWDMKNFNRGGGFGGDRGNNSYRGGYGGGNRGYDRPRETFRAVCDECGKDCEVPFRPTGSRPVLCSDCFEAKNGPRPQHQNRSTDNTRVRRFDRDGSPIETREERDNRNILLLKDEIAKLNEKVDKLTELMIPKESEEKTKTSRKKTKDK